ncbi:hypothetical protein T03_6089 [Trichinella britovi]|uniref:Uncharacterized protein n=1 Tax=Trichinella britovi TaxID=45882 RepID=A0A0V1AHH1_TRIBR|nr:hypothetical protein T03_6089 [Trichinella britovi]
MSFIRCRKPIFLLVVIVMQLLIISKKFALL